MDKQIRRLTIDDYDDVIRIWSITGLPFKPNGRDSRKMMAAEMALQICAFFGLFVDDRMVGVVITQYDGRRGWINRLAIDPDYRAMGLAADLIDRCEEFLDSHGEVVICALIEEENAPSMSCFGKAGFRCEDTIKYWTKRPRPDL